LNPKPRFELIPPTLPEHCCEPWAQKKLCLFMCVPPWEWRLWQEGAKVLFTPVLRFEHKEVRSMFQLSCFSGAFT
jgi:hypothetical protein